MRRVLRPGGLMVFSSHNANYLPAIVDRFRFRIHASLRETLRSFKWSSVFWMKNGLLQYRMPLASGRVHDGTHSFRSSALYYVRPDLGVAELRRLGMVDIACAGNESRDFVPGDDPRLPQDRRSVDLLHVAQAGTRLRWRCPSNSSRRSRAFERLRTEWNELVDAMEFPEIFYRWEWSFLFFRHCRAGDDPFIVVARNAPEGKIAALAPLCLRRARSLGIAVTVAETIVARPRRLSELPRAGGRPSRPRRRRHPRLSQDAGPTAGT